MSKGEFSERAMNDTKYLSKVAREYLLTLFGRTKENEIHINTIKGGLTAKIRNKYKLNDILYSVNMSNLTEDEKREKLLMLSTKNRNDHRHHSIDAFVIAMCNRKIIQALSHKYDNIEDNKKILSGFNNIKDSLREKVNNINVYIKPTHSSQGRLNEETNYGAKITENEKQYGYSCYKRLPLINLTDKQVENIRDTKIREEIQKEIKESTLSLQDILKQYGEKHNIRNIRILEKEQGLIPITTVNASNKQDIRYIKAGENHHLEYWKLPENVDIQKLKEKLSQFEKEGILTWLDKNNRYCCLTYNYFTLNKILSKDKNYRKLTSKTKEQRQKEIDKKDVEIKKYKSAFNDYKPHSSAKLIMKLHKRDIVRCLDDKGQEILARVVSLKPSKSHTEIIVINDYRCLQTSKQLSKDTNDNNTIKEFSIRFSNFKQKQLRSVYISPIGELYDSNKWFEEND